MKQFTIFNRLAAICKCSSMKNSACGAINKNRYYLFYIILLLTLGTGNAWGAEATLSFADKAQRTSFSTAQQVWEQNGITFTNAKAASTTNVADYAKPARLYAGSSVTIECSSGNITQIVFDCNSSSYATALKNSIGSSATASSDKVTIALDGSTTTFTIAKLTAQVRLDAITVTYEEGSSTVSVTSVTLNETELDLIVDATEQLTATVLPNDATNKNVSWSSDKTAVATVSYNGLVTAVGEGKATITVTTEDGGKTATCSVTVNPKPKYTVTWNVNGDKSVTTQVTEGSKPTLPATPESCDDESDTFYGWSTAKWDGKINDVSTKTIYTSANDMPEVNGDVTYYAVFAKEGTSGSGTAGWGKVTSTADLKAGDIYAISNDATGGTYLSTYTGGNNYPASSTIICKLELGGSSGAWTFKIADGSSYDNYYLTATSTTSSNHLKAVSTVDNNCKFSISFSSNAAVITCTGKSSRNILRYNGSNNPPIFSCYSSGQSAVYLQKYSAGSTTTYSDYITTCTKETSQLATPNVTLTYDCTTATMSWDNVANASAYWYQIKKTIDADAGTSSVNTTYTRNDLEQGTSYTWSVKAIGDGTTYLTSEIATGTFTTGYTITYETNGGSAVENACGTKLPSPLPTTTQDGYNFLGWYTDVDLTNQATAGAYITKNTTLYAKWEKAKTATSLTWSADSYTATIASESNVFPTLTIYPESNKESVTYSSLRPEYATIDAAGNIRLLAAGTTTITASYAGDEDYAAAEDTYTLTVEKSDNCRWEEVTNLNDIASGDEVVITMTKGNYVWTISNEKHTSNTAPTTVDISANVEGQYLTTVNDGNKWVIEKNNDNLTFYSYTDQANYLYCTNDDNGVRVGTGTAEVFVVDGNYLKNIETTSPRYLGVSLNTEPYSWRCYTVTTSVIKDQTLKFYKKVCLPNNISRVTYSVGAGDTAPAEQEVENTTSITLPSITTSLTCVNFVGWTDAASGYTHGTDNLYKAGDSYTVTENVTLHAVYAAGGGYVLVTDEANLAVDDKVIIVSATADGNSKFWALSTTQNNNNRGQEEVQIIDNTIEPSAGVQILTLETGTKTGTFAFNTGEGYLYAASSGSNYLKTQDTNNDNGSWTIEINNTGIATIKAQGTNTRNWLRYNAAANNGQLFSCYASGQSDVSIYKEDVAGYTTDPACVTYKVTTCTSINNGTISVDPTTVDPYGSATITFAPASGYMLQAVTVTPGTAIVGAPSYTTSQISGGTVRITDIQSDIEVCATFVEIPYYKVTFVDMNNGNSTQEVSQSGFGADITAPTTASDGCDATWTFIGWAPSNSLTGATEEPDDLVTPGGTISGSQITSNDLTYYSVYSNSSDGTPPFSIGKSGTYFMYALNGSTKYYATTAKSNGTAFNANTEADFAQYGNPSTFTLSYNSTSGTYKIKHRNTTAGKESEGYFYQADPTENDITINSETNYTNFIITAGNATGSNRITFTYNSKTGNFGYSSGFQGYAAGYDIYFEPASEMRYYNASSCTELVTMTFDVPADAELTYENGYPEGYYKDSEKKNVSTFPTLTYEGWTFIGWTAGASYNDQIGDANLDDENSSPNAPSATIYKTGGETYYLGADVTMYPVFTKFADNEPFDMVNGGDYYIYYIADGDVATSEDEYGATNRIYAGGWGSGGTSNSYGSTQSCASATLFTFTKLSNGKWSIYDNTKGKYLCAGATDNNLALNTTTATYGEWTITVHNGNQVNAVSKDGYTLSAQSQDAVTGTFKNYATGNFNDNSAYYHRVYVGSCTERVYSSGPSNKPKITLNGTAAVTSTKDQTIRSAKSLTLSAVKLAANGTITLTSDNSDVYFSTDKTANFSKGTKPVASLTINADANGKLALTTVYVHYKPAAVPTSNLDMQTVIITATTGTDGQPNYAIATTTATVRNLPADFVIAAKVNDIWYALPNNCNSTSIVNGLPIDVDDPINPTSATFAPAEAKWGLKPVYTTSGANDRYADYGEYFVFAETNTGTAGLLYSNKDNAQVQTQGTYSGISGYQEISRYEWIPTTTDLITYQLAGAQDSKQLNINVNGVFGTHSQLVAENELRLLPIDAIYQHAEVQVVEWRADAVVFMYTGDPNHSVTATLASTSTTKSLSESKIKFDHGVYKMPVSNLLSNAGKTMSIKFHDGSTEVARTEITIPVIINGETNTSSLTALAKADYETLDVVILNGGKLTATEGDAAKYRFRNVTVYGGGKLIIGEGKYLSMASIILRAGGFADDGAYEYVYPQFELKGNLTNTAGKFYYDYITDYDHWYHLVLPFAGDLGTIKYPTEFYGSNVTTSNSGSWIIKRYAGDIRATGNYSAWVDIESEGTDKTTPGVGYIFWGAPKKVTVNGDKQRQQWGIQRISMTKGAGTAKDEEKADKTISNLSSYENVANNSGKVNDQGWNLIGNPYMVNLTTMAEDGLKAGKLKKEMVDGNWTGKWFNNGDGIRYLTIPSNHFDTYEAKTVSAAKVANNLVPGRAFFVQLEGEADGVTFAAANRASLMPQHLAAQNTEVAVETGIVLSSETMQDEVNFWIKDGKTNDYEYNADYPKTPNNTNFNIYGVHAHGDLSWMATGPEYAEESMPIGYQVPAAGTYTLSISETYYSDILDALYVTDHAMSPELTVDLMNAPYEFLVNQAETNNERFTVSVILKSENQGPTTGVDNTGAQRDGVTKFIYQDKMFILHNGIIYNATGKKVTTINK